MTSSCVGAAGVWAAAGVSVGVGFAPSGYGSSEPHLPASAARQSVAARNRRVTQRTVMRRFLYAEFRSDLAHTGSATGIEPGLAV